MSARSTGARSRSRTSGRIGSAGRSSSVHSRTSHPGWCRFHVSIQGRCSAGSGSGPSQMWWMERGISSVSLTRRCEIPQPIQDRVRQLGAQVLLCNEPVTHARVVGGALGPVAIGGIEVRVPLGFVLAELVFAQVGGQLPALHRHLLGPLLEPFQVLVLCHVTYPFLGKRISGLLPEAAQVDAGLEVAQGERRQ